MAGPFCCGDRQDGGTMRILVIICALCGLFAGATLAVPASGGVVCTLVMAPRDARVLLSEGECDTPVTPASTFKIALAVIGFETGILTGPDTPRMSIRTGEPDWGGAAWQGPLGPRDWMAHSVVWYSQRIAKTLGQAELTRHARAYRYGNADFSGDPGKNNGLERAWIASSLRISPREQALFLSRLLRDDLPASPVAMAAARDLLAPQAAGGWQIAGKTGSAYPRHADGSFDRTRGWGWFVGWAERDGRMLVLVRLTQDSRRFAESPGLRARAAVLRDWPALARASGLPD